jgi:aubergine-like protein
VVQIACKLGCAPWAIKFPNAEKTMIVGIDLHHSGELVDNRFKKKSVVGFCATLGKDHTQYFTALTTQDFGTDIAQSLAPLLFEAIKEYCKRNNEYPQHVLFYRDGIGHSEINTVRQMEMEPMLDLLTAIYANEKEGLPEYTEDEPISFNYVVVLKNINTRLAIETNRGLDNPRPGTVVDDDITLPGVIEFFLIAHHSNIGSASPSRYQVHKNEGNFDANFYQDTTNKLCNLYYNWFGAIRTPAHCQYAHVLAKLAGQAEIKRDHPNLTGKLYFL